MISKFHFWSHVYLLNSSFQEYWECTRCGYRINAAMPVSFREGNTIHEKVPNSVLGEMERVNAIGCPFFIVQGIMQS
jgi:hypothetical protein